VSYVATGGRNLADGPPQTSSTTPSASPIAGSPPAAPPAPSTKAKRHAGRPTQRALAGRPDFGLAQDDLSDRR
jgi:hypothetical protein